MSLNKRISVLIALLFFFAVSAASYAADTVGMVDPQKILFQHPRFDRVTRLLIFLGRSVEGNVAQLVQQEQDPVRKEMLMQYSEQVMEFAAMDRAIDAEQDTEKKAALWADRQNKFSDFEASLMGPIMEDCQKAIQDVMTLMGMTVIIDLEATRFGGTDITEDVIQRLKR